MYRGECSKTTQSGTLERELQGRSPKRASPSREKRAGTEVVEATPLVSQGRSRRGSWVGLARRQERPPEGELWAVLKEVTGRVHMCTHTAAQKYKVHRKTVTLAQPHSYTPPVLRPKPSLLVRKYHLGHLRHIHLQNELVIGQCLVLL